MDKETKQMLIFLVIGVFVLGGIVGIFYNVRPEPGAKPSPREPQEINIVTASHIITIMAIGCIWTNYNQQQLCCYSSEHYSLTMSNKWEGYYDFDSLVFYGQATSWYVGTGMASRSKKTSP